MAPNIEETKQGKEILLMKNPEYDFLFHHVDISACGMHDLYNAFLREDGLVDQFKAWKEDFPGCIPIGVCPENRHDVSPMSQYIAMVFEDDRGGRYYIHIPKTWVDEAKVSDKGEKAMKAAREEAMYGCSEEEHFRRNQEAFEKAMKEQEENEAAARKQAEEEEKKQLKKNPPKIHYATFTVDSLHLLEQLFEEMSQADGSIGIAFGCKLLHSLLQRVAERAVELDDPKLHVLMMKMHLYTVEDGKWDELLQEFEEQAKQMDKKEETKNG